MKRSLSRWIEDWVEKLSQPDPEVNDLPLCPYAKPAFRKGQVKVIDTDNLWDTVHQQVEQFDGSYKVVMCVQQDTEQDYFELDAACMALNRWFVYSGLDVWLLSYQDDCAVVFIQTLSDLDDAADILQKLGYYDNYPADDYQRLIKQRSELRRRL